MRVHGVGTWVDPQQAKPILERSTIACGHCGKIVFIKPGTATTVYLIPTRSGGWIEEPGAFCGICQTPVCLPCHDHGTCRPLDVWLQQVERRV